MAERDVILMGVYQIEIAQARTGRWQWVAWEDAVVHNPYTDEAVTQKQYRGGDYGYQSRDEARDAAALWVGAQE